MKDILTYDGPGIGKGGTGVLKVDGKDFANWKIPRTALLTMPWEETFCAVATFTSP
jgi:hypothetical protein